MNKYLTTLLAIGTLALGAQKAHAISMDISSISPSGLTGVTTGSRISFDGSGNFSFTAAVAAGGSAYLSGAEFVVNSGSAVDFRGDIAGTFSIDGVSISGTTQTAPVSSVGVTTLSITDNLGFVFQGNIAWIQIKSDGTANSLNVGGIVNLTGITYVGGSNPDLVALKGSGNNASASLQFGFPSPGQTVTQLKTSAKDSSFTGDLSSSVPEGGSTALLLGLALLGFGIVAHRRLAGQKA